MANLIEQVCSLMHMLGFKQLDFTMVCKCYTVQLITLARKFGALHSINQYTAFILCCEVSQTCSYIFLCDLYRLQKDCCKLGSFFSPKFLCSHPLDLLCEENTECLGM